MSNYQDGFQGGCLCGQVRYTCNSAPVDFVLCHCRDCQYVSGGSPSAVVIVSRDAVTVEGELSSHQKAANSGTILTRQFCPNCGTHVINIPEQPEDLMVIKAGTMDDSSQLKATSEWWLSSAQPWSAKHGDMTHYNQNPWD